MAVHLSSTQIDRVIQMGMCRKELFKGKESKNNAGIQRDLPSAIPAKSSYLFVPLPLVLLSFFYGFPFNDKIKVSAVANFNTRG